ncbi:hypothetical protein CDAR_533621 [Caerostris darwini]|uniref:Uncharacterized protein n=1 Tax=Caerostris darwini TaxID=1538125 RepID=A0AAV4S4H4_9ARAC|nr:hypothetical protein CDAR_533621 [Caerostris darwini]
MHNLVAADKLLHDTLSDRPELAAVMPVRQMRRFQNRERLLLTLLSGGRFSGKGSKSVAWEVVIALSSLSVFRDLWSACLHAPGRNGFRISKVLDGSGSLLERNGGKTFKRTPG